MAGSLEESKAQNVKNWLTIWNLVLPSVQVSIAVLVTNFQKFFYLTIEAEHKSYYFQFQEVLYFSHSVSDRSGFCICPSIYLFFKKKWYVVFKITIQCY